MSDFPIKTASLKGLLGATADALAALFEPKDVDLAVDEALDQVGEATALDYLFVVQLTGEKKDSRAHWYRAWTTKERGAPWDNPSMQLLCRSYAEIFEHLRSSQLVCSKHEKLAAAEKAAVETLGLKSWAVAPLILRGEFWGFFGIGAGCELVIDDEVIACLKALAAGLGGALLCRQVEIASETQAQELRRHQRVALSLAEDARLSAQAAAQASVAKTTFLAMMSHEIRTPLNGVIGFTDLLLAEGLPERQSELAQGIRTCGEALLSLITDILDISKIEAGRLDLNPANADVRACARSVLAAFEPTARQNGIDLQLSVDDSVPPELFLDINYFRQILFNLVGNAVKFTLRGSVVVRLWAEMAEGGGKVRFCGQISDTGAGISPEDLQAIFEPFQQGKNAKIEAVGGSGLGLAICGRLIAAMGGEINVESTRGQGSQFNFHIAVQKRSEVPPVQTTFFSKSLDADDLALAVLVVDDVPTNVRLAVSLLKRFGFRPDAASSGGQALGMVDERSYDLIFMDILMPEMDGYETVRRIRAAEETTGRPRSWIVAITADALPENRQKCAEVGMDYFLTKPLRINDMDQALTRWKESLSHLSK